MTTECGDVWFLCIPVLDKHRFVFYQLFLMRARTIEIYVWPSKEYKNWIPLKLRRHNNVLLKAYPMWLNPVKKKFC